MNLNYIVQVRGARKYTQLFEAALEIGNYRKLLIAVAYATIGGVKVIERTFQDRLGDEWHGIEKKWLVGIDWCRSDPPALSRLANFGRSQVRIPNGKSLVEKADCTPRDTYHPKLFVLCGDDVNAIICGSGNLSANGLLRGCECGSLVVSEGQDKDSNQELALLLAWFRKTWQSATEYELIRTKYEKICKERARRKRLVPTEDDVRPPEAGSGKQRRGLTEEQIRQLRTFEHLWIDAGALGANLRRGFPGNQLDMTRFTRAFFDADVDNVPPNSPIGSVTLVWQGQPHPDRTLKFGDNGMDKLNVPPPGDRGASFYRGKTLLFTRLSDGSYDFKAGARTQRQKWRKKSERQGFIYTIGNREWGLF